MEAIGNFFHKIIKILKCNPESKISRVVMLFFNIRPMKDIEGFSYLNNYSIIKTQMTHMDFKFGAMV